MIVAEGVNNAFIVVEKGAPFVKREVVKLSAPSFLIGRECEDSRPDLSFTSVYISRRHAVIQCGNHQFYIVDNSKHGVRVNGSVIPKNSPHPLKHGDRISLADDEAILTFSTGSNAIETWAKPKKESVEIVLNEAKREITVDGHPIELTGNLYALFRLFYQNRGKAVSSMEIKRYVWPERQLDHNLPMVGDEEVIVLVKRLREKLGPFKDLIGNKRGYGYILS